MHPPSISDASSIPAKAGIGLRFQHHQAVLDTQPDVAWMEVHTENYMGGGTPLKYLDAIRRDTPISLHGVGLSLGSAEGVDPAHLERILKVAERVEPGLMSEHIAWNLVGGTYLAGHSIRTFADGSSLRIDDHGSMVTEEVWTLYRQAVARFGAVPTLIEWDNEIPPLDVLLDEAQHAERVIAAWQESNGHADAA